MEVIKANHLTKKYGNFMAVDHVSFEVKKGTMLGFLGVNGAGKTTVINMLSTLLSPEEGEAVICGNTLGKNNEEIRRKIGIVYQQNCLDDILSVQENLICRGILHGAGKKEAKKQCKRLAEILKLEDILTKRYGVLSGGQKRRCEIAAALMHTPEILFLDEPTTGLDPATRVDVWNTIRELQKNEKMTVFLTTHYMEEAAGADKIIIMDRGHIITEGTPFALKEKFAKDKLKLYVSSDKISLIKEALGKRLKVSDCCKGNLKKEEAREEKILKKDSGENLIQTEYNMVEWEAASTLETLPIINFLMAEPQFKDAIQGFEVIQGNMDDVFLNAVGKELNHGEV